MNVLLLHPEDPLSGSSKIQWDLIVDFARAPAAAYEECANRNACMVKSVFDFADGMRDLYKAKELLQPGAGLLLDDQGIDWWEMFLPSLAPQLQQLILLERLVNELGNRCNLWITRPDWRARALEYFSGTDVQALDLRAHNGNLLHRGKHYLRAARKLDPAQLQQVLWDKFDRYHICRARMSRRPKLSGTFVLLPSAYVNVSRMAVAYTKLLPEQKFLLVCARSNAQLSHLPANVRQISLDPYFRGVPEETLARLTQAVGRLKVQLAASSKELRAAIALGQLDSIVPFMRWGLTIRRAWENLFSCVEATACFSTDDSNPYTRIPLLLAKRRKLPALACHHGALDCLKAVKAESSDVYLAKNQMEYDYLRRVCHLPASNMMMAGPPRPAVPIPAKSTNNKRRWLVFFSEPVSAMHWRADHVYRDLLPRLFNVAEQCGLKMVFKLHPFESVGAFRRLLKNVPGRKASAKASMVLTGAMTDEFWENMSCAIVIQSSVAIECAERGIPVFLCNWLADSCSEYIQQFARYGAGHVLQHPAEMEDIADVLPRLRNTRLEAGLQSAPDAIAFRDCLSGNPRESMAAQV